MFVVVVAAEIIPQMIFESPLADKFPGPFRLRRPDYHQNAWV